MKAPLSHHLAVATAEITRKFPRLPLVDLLLVVAFSAGALVWNAHWLFILAALALGEAAMLYMGRGVLGLLDTADRSGLAELQEKYRW